MFRRGLVDTEPIGTSTLPNRVIHHGVMKQFSTCIDTVSKRGLEGRIRITAACAERCTCSPLQNLTHSLLLCWMALNRWGCDAFRTRMVAGWRRQVDARLSMKRSVMEKGSPSSV